MAVPLALLLRYHAEVRVGGGQVAFELDDVGDGRRAQMGGQPAGQNLHGTGGLDQDDARSLGVHDGVHAGVRVVDGVSGGNVDMHGLVGHAGQSLDAGGDQHHFVGHAAGAGAQGAGGGGGFSDNACFHVHITFPMCRFEGGRDFSRSPSTEASRISILRSACCGALVSTTSTTAASTSEAAFTEDGFLPAARMSLHAGDARATSGNCADHGGKSTCTVR